MSVSDALDWAVFNGGPYLVAVWTVVLIVFIALTIRKEWRHLDSMSEQRLMAVRDYTEPRLVVPEHWTSERTR